MAPFYALIMSFAIVLLLGLVFEAPATEDKKTDDKAVETTTPPPAVTPPTAFSAEDSEDFPGSDLTLVYGDKEKKVRDLAKIPSLRLLEKYTICAVLDDGWTGVDATRAPNSDYSCWGPFDPKSDNSFVLRVEAAE
jgi:hypothetical protein